MTTHLATSPAPGHRRPACRVPRGIAAMALLAAACGGDPAAPAGSAAEDSGASAATTGAATDADAGAADTQVAADPEAAGHATGITVVGEGRVEVRPDVARAVVGVEVTRSDPGDAFADASSAAAAVLDALRDEGVADHHLRTVELSLRQDRQPGPRTPTPSRRGATWPATSSR
jgi:uncharacterized protein YggE